MNKQIVIILIIGVIYRLFLTANGNFLFNMDNARDMVDVREMVVLGKLRLTGPTSAIEGLFNGPFWYYLLAIPFIITGGDPYASIVMEIILWAIGGFFLLKLVSRWGSWLIFPVGAIWVTSDYIVLANLYAFNPNPVTLLTPLFIYLLVKFLENGKVVNVILVWFLAGLFFNFEMNFGIFTPIIIFVSLIFARRTRLLKDKTFWLGFAVFLLLLLPQVIFDLKHQFIMSSAVKRFLTESNGYFSNLVKHAEDVIKSFYNTFLPILLNHKNLVWIVLFAAAFVLIKFFESRTKKDVVVVICLLYIFVPFLGYLILPVSVNPWHLGGPMAASIILIGFVLKQLLQFKIWGKVLSLGLTVIIIWFGVSSLLNYFLNERGKANGDPSLLKNEIAVIDHVYQKASGKNFKVYSYLPSVYDYPYQYLFWWYGQKQYGYIPGEYVYSPNKPPYIPSQNKFQGIRDNLSGLVFLIKEPDRIGYRQAWESDYKDMEFVSKEMVGSLEVEVRREVKE